MKINRLETHDRLEHFVQDQSINIFQGAEDCLKKNPLSLKLQEKSPYIYMFAHPRTADDGVNKRMLWQPRLTKPMPQTNSYLFRVKSQSTGIEVVWLLPPESMWDQYKKGNVTEHELVIWSIDQYKTNRHRMGMPEPDDLADHQARSVYEQVVLEMKQEAQMNKIYNIKDFPGEFLAI